MPLPDFQLTNLEAIVYGQITSGGSSAPRTVNVFHYRRLAVAVPVSKTAFDTAFQSAIVTKMGLAFNNRWTQTNNTIRFINDQTDPPTTFSHAVAGAVTGDSLSSIAAVFTLLRTALKGRTYRGGKHFGPLSEADVTTPDDDILNAAAIARFAALVTAMGTDITDATGNTWRLSVVSRLLSNFTVQPCIVIANDVNAILLNKRVGRQAPRAVRSVY